jgi:hypothetical protein
MPPAGGLKKIERLMTMQIMTLKAALRPLAAIADAYDADELDHARPSWGGVENPSSVELYSGRGGRQLLTLAHAFAARDALRSGEGLDEAAEPLVCIARAYDENNLDDEARKFWGDHLQHRNTTPLDQINLVEGRGGRDLLSLGDADNARYARAQAREDARNAARAAA